jgi:hypothetical protein
MEGDKCRLERRVLVLGEFGEVRLQNCYLWNNFK